MNDLTNISSDTNTTETYTKIRSSVIAAQGRIYTAVNSAMVQAYWEIGEQIYIACGKNDRAEYGKGLLKFLSEKLTAEFGKGFTVSNLRNMRQFYQCYQKRYTLCSELSWSHYRILIRLSDDKRRAWYTEECAKSGWSVRQLERQINTIFDLTIFSRKLRNKIYTRNTKIPDMPWVAYRDFCVMQTITRKSKISGTVSVYKRLNLCYHSKKGR